MACAWTCAASCRPWRSGTSAEGIDHGLHGRRTTHDAPRTSHHPRRTVLMMYRARAPMRVDLAGGWTDVAPYAGAHGGAVVNVAITLYAYAVVRTGGREVRLNALDLGATVSAQRADELRAD